MSQRFTFVWQRRNLRPPKAHLWFSERLPGMINYKLQWQTFVWAFITQDKQDEHYMKCGNFYGSNAVSNDNFKEGLEINANLKATYNLSTNKELTRFCRKNFLNKSKVFHFKNSKFFSKDSTKVKFLMIACVEKWTSFNAEDKGNFRNRFRNK